MRSGKKTCLYAVNADDEVVYHDDKEGLQAFHVKSFKRDEVGKDFWKGCNEDWDLVLKEVSVKGMTLRQIANRFYSNSSLVRTRNCLSNLKKKIPI